MSECTNCGNNVSATFARVYGDNNNNVHRCMSCVEKDAGGRRMLRCGGGAIKDEEEVRRRMKTDSGA